MAKKYRKKMSKKASQRNFKKKTHTHRRNINSAPMRGGIRL